MMGYRNLEDIMKELVRIQAAITFKSKRQKLTALFFAKSHAAALQECRDDLDWAMEEFDVREIIGTHASFLIICVS